MSSSPRSTDPTEPAEPAGPPVERGGDQHIPRPPVARDGARAPWAELTNDRRRITVADLRTALDTAGPAVPSPAEGLRPRASAVLAACYEHAGEAWVVLTRRAGHLRSHRGEVSFPGGGQEPGDADLWATALREAREEIGLEPGSVSRIGELDHLSTVTSQSFIVPFVAELEGPPELVADPAEVDRILHVPLSELLDPAIFREERWESGAMDMSVVFFELVGETLWGATGAMVRQLLGLVTGTVGRGELGHH